MVSSEFRTSFAKGYLLLTNVLSTVKIEKLVVPSVVQAGSSDVVLDCQFAVAGEAYTLQWWFSGSNDSKTLVYEWTPPLPPTTAGILEGRTALSCTNSITGECHGIRLLRVDPHLSGEYTCVVASNGVQARETKPMLVYSPEDEFEMTLKQKNNHSNLVEIACFARGVYPQPDLILEYEKEPIAQQVQRVWYMNSLLQYDAESVAYLSNPPCRVQLEVTCRLHLPQADYTAIKKKYYSFDHECINSGQKICSKQLLVVLILHLLLT